MRQLKLYVDVSLREILQNRHLSTALAERVLYFLVHVMRFEMLS